MSENLKQGLSQLENEQIQVEKIFRKMAEEEENDLQDIKQQLAQISYKHQRWQQDTELAQLYTEEETVLIERFNHQQQFLGKIAEQRTNYQKQFYQTKNDLRDQLKHEQIAHHKEDSDGITR